MKRRIYLLVLGAMPLTYLACGDEGDSNNPRPDGGGVDAGDMSDSPTGDDGSSPVDAGPPCPAPTDPAKAALCLYLTPEAINFVANDPDYDGHGILGVQVYSDSAGSDDGGLGQPILVPAQPDGGQPDGGPVLMDLAGGVPMVRFDGLPTTVYMRAVFFDSAFASSSLRPGWWLAGHDTANGVLGSKLAPITLVAGQGTNATFDLRALRKLTVTVSRAPGTTPEGNGQGPIQSLVIDKQVADSTAKGYGVATLPCGDLSGDNPPVTVEGFVMGTGPYWLTGTLDDFNDGGVAPPGSMISYGGPADGGLTLPEANKVSYDAKAYKVTHTIQLNHALDNGLAVDLVRCK